jgi:hypothetical protein
MQMGMKQQVLSPGVQDGRDTNLRPQPFWIGSQREQGLGGRAKEQVIEPSGMVQHQGIQGRRQGEDDVEIFHGQQSLQSGLQPFGAFARLTLGTVPVALPGGRHRRRSG